MKDRQLNILIVASWYKSKEMPTSGTFIEEQARMLHKEGHNVIVLHPYLMGTFFKTLFNRKKKISKLTDNEIITYRIGVSPFLPKFRKLSYLKLVNQTINLFNKENSSINKFDLIHSHSLFMGGVIGYYLSKHWGIPLFHTEHTSSLVFKPSDYNYSDKKMIKKIYNHATNVFFVSTFFQNKMIKEYNLVSNKNLGVLPNLVNTIFFQPEDFPKESFKVLVIGDFIEIKQHQLIIDAWKIIDSKIKDATLTLIGEGPLLNEIKEKVFKLNLISSVNFVERQSRENIRKYIVNHHMIVSCSKLETFGLSIAEAIASGRPVVATNSGGVSDIINSQNGIILKTSSPSELAKSILKVLTNINDFNPATMSLNLKSKFGEDHIYNLLKEKYYSNTNQ